MSLGIISNNLRKGSGYEKNGIIFRETFGNDVLRFLIYKVVEEKVEEKSRKVEESGHH